MSETFACPSCGSRLKRSSQIVTGVLVKCPRCDTEFTVPPDDDGRPRVDDAPRPRPAEEPPRRWGDDEPGQRWRDQDRMADRPTPPRRAPEPDEDIPPRGRTRGDIDLSGQQPVDIGDWMSRGQARWGEFLGPAIGAFFLIILIHIGFSLIPILGIILHILFDPALMAGTGFAAVRCLRRERWEFGDFFAGFQKWGSLWLANFVIGMVTILSVVPFVVVGVIMGIAVGASSPRPDPALIILVIAAMGIPAFCLLVFLAMRWQFTFLLILDQGMTSSEAMSASWKLTRGKVLGLFAFAILLALIMFAGALACGVGILFAFPLVALVHAAAYLGLTGQQREGGRLLTSRRDDFDRPARRDDFDRPAGRWDDRPRDIRRDDDY